jgi:hypothetical protein
MFVNPRIIVAQVIIPQKDSFAFPTKFHSASTWHISQQHETEKEINLPFASRQYMCEQPEGLWMNRPQSLPGHLLDILRIAFSLSIRCGLRSRLCSQVSPGWLSSRHIEQFEVLHLLQHQFFCIIV